jgi:hypothetical protein
LSVKKLSERFLSFKDAQLQTLTIVSPTEIKLSIAVQDTARSFDWISLELHFYEVQDASLLDEKKFPYIDTSSGMTLLQEDGYIAFGTGECYNIENIKNQTLYIIAKTLKTSESAF